MSENDAFHISKKVSHTVSLFDINLLFSEYEDKYLCPSYENLQLVFKKVHVRANLRTVRNVKNCAFSYI